MKEPLEIKFGDRVSTTDSDQPLPVRGFRSSDDGTRARPWILVGGAWYYPHELESAPQPDRAVTCGACPCCRAIGSDGGEWQCGECHGAIHDAETYCDP